MACGCKNKITVVKTAKLKPKPLSKQEKMELLQKIMGKTGVIIFIAVFQLFALL